MKKEKLLELKTHEEEYKAMSDTALRTLLDSLSYDLEDYPEFANLEELYEESLDDYIDLFENNFLYNIDCQNFACALLEYTKRNLKFKRFTSQEIINLVFENLDKLEEVSFNIGNGRDHLESYTINPSETSSEIKIMPSIFFDPYYHDYEVDCPKETVIEMIKKLNLKEWKEDYKNDQPKRSYWSFELNFDDSIPDYRIEGNNTFPENFDLLENFFSSFLKYLDPEDLEAIENLIDNAAEYE